MYSVSKYSNSKDAASKEVVDLFTFLTGDEHKDKILLYRKEIENWRSTACIMDKPTKTGIPMVTVAGTFSYRQTDHLTHFNKLVCVDVDGVDNPEEIKQRLTEFSNVWFIGKSASGYGLCVIIKVNCEAERFQDAYFKLEEWFQEEFAIAIDGARKDIVGARYASYDENYYYNPDATEMSVPKRPVKEVKVFDNSRPLDERSKNWVAFVEMFKDDFNKPEQGYKWLTHKVFAAKNSEVPIDVVKDTILKLSDGPSSTEMILYQIDKIYSK